METFSALLTFCAGNSPVTGEFPSQRSVTRSFDIFFYLCLNERLSKQSKRQWFETPSHPLLRHCNRKVEGSPTCWFLVFCGFVFLKAITVDVLFFSRRLCSGNHMTYSFPGNETANSICTCDPGYQLTSDGHLCLPAPTTLGKEIIHYTVRCRYNAINFLPNSHTIHPIARPLGRGMGCILWIQAVIYNLPQSLQLCI